MESSGTEKQDKRTRKREAESNSVYRDLVGSNLLSQTRRKHFPFPFVHFLKLFTLYFNFTQKPISICLHESLKRLF